MFASLWLAHNRSCINSCWINKVLVIEVQRGGVANSTPVSFEDFIKKVIFEISPEQRKELLGG